MKPKPSTAAAKSIPSPTRTASYREFKSKVERILPISPVFTSQRTVNDKNTQEQQQTTASTLLATSSSAQFKSTVRQLLHDDSKDGNGDISILELSTPEQAIVLVVVICGLCVLALILVSTWNLVRYLWQYVQEQRTLRRLFLEQDAQRLSLSISKYPVTSSLLIRKVAMARLRHLEFVAAATSFDRELAALSFDDESLLLTGLPKRVDTKKEMTLLEVIDRLEQIHSTGDYVVIEIMAVSGSVPSRWKRYADTHAWLTTHDACVQQLAAQSVKVQQLSSCISDLLMDKLQAGEAIQKGKFVNLLSALRQSSAPALDENGRQQNGSLSSSMNLSASMGGGSSRVNGSASKDEFSFFVKAFDEINEQHQVKQELQQAMLSLNSSTTVNGATTSSAKLEVTRTTEAATSPVNGQVHHSHSFAASGAGDSEQEKVLLTRKLEKFVDRAEMLEVTHFEEVERAQYALENTRRENFCAAIFNKDAKVLENVESLALNFVSMGAERKDAVLKAGEILANRSNTMLLVNSLRGMFDELRKQDIMKMNERRKRDATKQLDKRERMGEKFRLKQQLVVEKLELQRQAQKQREEEERVKRVQQEQIEWRRHLVRERKKFVWLVTKVNLLIVLLVMALVFFESLRQLAFIKPVCPQEKDTKFSGVLSLFGATNSLAVLGCQVAYGAKMAVILLLIVLAFFVLSQLNMLVVVLPVVLALALYHVRAEWMNMLVRVPLLAVVYGFNSTCLYLLNRSEEEAVVATVGVPATAAAVVTESSKQRVALVYFVFPLVSIALSVLIGIGIACDDPQQCATTAFHTVSPGVRGLVGFAREAYGF